jgi:myo-inositol 2-dehydrogenase/D-chiro-inositol 1-dehydrogenase
VAETPFGVGLIGCGTIGQVHAAGLGQLVEDGVVRAVAAADPSEQARAAADRNARGFANLYDDARAVIEDDEVEGVIIASPTATHRDLVLATIDAGKPMLCEKPLAPVFPIVREMHDAVVTSGLTAQVGFHSRFHYLFNALKDLVDGGELGAPMGYVLREDQFWPTGDIMPGHSSWRSDRSQAGGGALLEHTIHGADVVSWLFGPAVQVFGRTRSQFGYDVEDVAAATVVHESGVVGTFLSVFNGVRGREERRLEIFFEQAAVESTADFIVGAPEDGLMIQRPNEEAERPDLEALRTEHWRRLGLTRPDIWFYLYIGAYQWIRAVRDGASASPGFGDALAAHALVEAAYRSAATNAPVDLTGDLALPNGA